MMSTQPLVLSCPNFAQSCFKPVNLLPCLKMKNQCLTVLNRGFTFSIRQPEHQLLANMRQVKVPSWHSLISYRDLIEGRLNPKNTHTSAANLC